MKEKPEQTAKRLAKARGYSYPEWEYLAEKDPEFLEAYNRLSGLSLLERTLEVRTSLRRDNYLFFSVFHVRVMRRDHAFVGVLGGFVGVGDARRAVPGSS